MNTTRGITAEKSGIFAIVLTGTGIRMEGLLGVRRVHIRPQ
jgi:hypothetical protein